MQKLLVLFTLSCAACSSSSSGTDAGVADLSMSSAPDLTAPADLSLPVEGKVVSDALAQRVMGSYAMQVTIAATLDLPIVGKMPSTSVLLALVDIARDGTGLKTTETSCHVTILGNGIATTTVPDALPRSVPPVVTEFRVWETGAVVNWLRPETVTPVGAKLTAPATEALPTTAADARVWDQDMDGQPGVTVKLSGIITGDIYVVQKQRIYYSGTVAADDKISGTNFDTSEQQVIGASIPALMQNVPSTPNPDPTKNPVRYTKLSTAYTCDQLVADAATLFP